MPTDDLDSLIIEPSIPASASVIWLHGLGADGNDFAPIVPQLQITTPVRYVFPHAPQRPITINGGYVMRAWYDIVSFERPREEDEAGIRASSEQVHALIEREISRGVAADRILLAGFSQGGAIALHAGLRFPRRLAGVLALSTYLPLAERLANEASPANRTLPIFMAHGSEDTVIALPHALASKQKLETLGFQIEWHSYPMAHSVNNEEIEDIGRYLVRVLGDAPTR